MPQNMSEEKFLSTREEVEELLKQHTKDAYLKRLEKIGIVLKKKED